MYPCEAVAFPKTRGLQLHNAFRQNDGVESGSIEGGGLNLVQASHVGKVKDAGNVIIPSPLVGKVPQLGWAQVSLQVDSLHSRAILQVVG